MTSEPELETCPKCGWPRRAHPRTTATTTPCHERYPGDAGALHDASVGLTAAFRAAFDVLLQIQDNTQAIRKALEDRSEGES
jgi:hypothetical protein